MTTAKGLATRDRILDAVTDALVRGGRESINLDEVRLATGTSKSQLFHYFPGGKRELIHAATQRQLDQVAAALTAPLETMDAWRDWVERTIELHRQQTRDDACAVAAIAARILDPEPDDLAAIGTTLTLWHRHFADGIRSMQARGSLAETADADGLASLFAAVVQGGAVLDKATRDAEHLERSLRLALTQLDYYVIG